MTDSQKEGRFQFQFKLRNANYLSLVAFLHSCDQFPNEVVRLADDNVERAVLLNSRENIRLV